MTACHPFSLAEMSSSLNGFFGATAAAAHLASRLTFISLRACFYLSPPFASKSTQAKSAPALALHIAFSRCIDVNILHDIFGRDGIPNSDVSTGYLALDTIVSMRLACLSFNFLFSPMII